MAPEDDTEPTADAGDSGPSYVYCPECDTRASADWAFCRSCQASLDDAVPADEKLVVRNDGEKLSTSQKFGTENRNHKRTSLEAR